MTDGAGAKYHRIADDLRQAIASGKISVGGKIPTRTQLMGDYDVALNTVDRALTDLRREGLIRTEQGAGTFVIKTPRDPEPSPEFQEMAAQFARLSDRLEVVERKLGLDGHDDPGP